MSEASPELAARLDALAARVGAAETQAGAEAPNARRARIEREMLDAVSGLPAGEQLAALAGVIARLSGARTSAGTGAKAAPGASTPDLRSKLQCADNESPDPQRAQELAAMLCDFAIGVDRVVWGMWSQKLAPQSTLRSAGPIRRFMKEHVLGAPAGGGPAVSGEVRRLLEMTVALVSSIGQAGASFGDKFVSQYSPGSIEDSVGDAAFRNKDAECWKIYKSRAASLDRPAIDAEVTQAMARFVEDWMKRTVRT